MASKIDYDRGVHIRGVDAIGLDVYMYVDSPGVYLNAHGSEVTEAIARQAGFPVDDHMKQRRLKERMASAMQKIKEEMDAQGEEKEVLITRDGFSVLGIGLDRYQVLSPEGDVLTKAPMSKAEALIVFDQLVPEKSNEPDSSGGGSGGSKPAARNKAAT